MNTIDKPNIPLILYHANCADGFGAAFAAWKHFGNEAEYRAVKYGECINKADVLNRTVVILDFSYPKNTMDDIFDDAAQVVWLDHHKTAFEMYGLPLNDETLNYYTAYDIGLGYDSGLGTDSRHKVVLDNTRSGAMIAWDWFQGHDTVPKLIEHIDDYDRWQFKIHGTKEFNKFLWSTIPWSFEQWNNILTMPEPVMHGTYVAGEAILRAHNQNVQAVIASSKQPCTIVWWDHTPIENPHEDHKNMTSAREVYVEGLAVNCPKHLASDVGHHLATECGTFGLTWFQRADGKLECSLRSNGYYDVSAIAKKFGGGGHRNAAGFELASMSILQSWFYPNRRFGK